MNSVNAPAVEVDKLAQYRQPIRMPQHVKDSEVSGWLTISTIVLIAAAILAISIAHKNVLDAWIKDSVFSQTNVPGQFSITVDYDVSSLFWLIPLGIAGIAIVAYACYAEDVLSAIGSIALIMVSGLAILFMPMGLPLSSEVLAKNLNAQQDAGIVEESYSTNNNEITLSDGFNGYVFDVNTVSNEDGSNTWFLDLKNQ